MDSIAPTRFSKTQAVDARRLTPQDSPVSRRPGPRRPRLAEDLRLVAAGAGDHATVHYFLQSIFHGPSTAEFQAQLEAPFYEPSNRLLITRGEKLVAHLRLCNRELHFGRQTLPVTQLCDLATAPELRRQGCATALLTAAMRQMISQGSVMGMLRTRLPDFYRRRGWTVCGRHCFSVGQPRDILSHLSAYAAPGERALGPSLATAIGPRAQPSELNIRLWRHIEQAALMRLYAENTVNAYGPPMRSEAYWRWLIARRSYDRIYVAIDGPDKLQLDDVLDPIVGYAAMREGRIVEMMASSDQPSIVRQLLQRACGDAIERDYHLVRFDGPPGHPLHQLIQRAGGNHCHHEAENGEVFMVNIPDPPGLLRRLCPLLHRRAKAANLPARCELGLRVDAQKFRLVVSQRSVKLISGKLGRSYITCQRGQLIQLLLGHLRVAEMCEAGRIEASTRVAIEVASALFPALPFWCPPLDELPT